MASSEIRQTPGICLLLTNGLIEYFLNIAKENRISNPYFMVATRTNLV